MLKLENIPPDLTISAENVGGSIEKIWLFKSSTALADFSGILKDKRNEFYFIKGTIRSKVLTIKAHRMFDNTGHIIKRGSEMTYEFNDAKQDITKNKYSITGNVRGKEDRKDWGPEIRILVKN